LVWLKKLQAVLGDWHDLEMSEALLAEIVGDARFIRDNLAQTPAVLRLIGIDRKTKEKLRQKGIETLRRVMGSGDIRNRIEAAP
jgi:CHAD domain-containing protein